MPRANALLLESVHSNAQRELADQDVSVHVLNRALPPDELISELKKLGDDVPAIVGIRSKTRVTEAVLDAVPNLAAIGAFCIGTDQIDLARARRGGVAVFNAPFSSTRSVAELVIGEIIMLSRQIFPRNWAAHDGTWAKSASGAHEVRGKVLGIVGYGHIGSQLSVLAESLGMRVRYYDVVTKLPLGNAVACSSLEQLLAESDFVSLHVPDTEQTRGMLTEGCMRTMKAGSYLINASRGQVVDIAALRKVLEEEYLAGAAVDVYPKEPASPKDPFASELQGLHNVILTPHIGGSTLEAQANIGLEVATAVGKFLGAGGTQGAITLPHLDVPLRPGITRVLNMHRNVPGVLSAINKIVADSGVNIVGQHLATLDEISLLLVDFATDVGEAQARALVDAIDGHETSVRTRLLAG